MRYYIDPKNETKEEFLEKWGYELFTGLSRQELLKTFYEEFEDSYLVCLVTNGCFNAAAICVTNGAVIDYTRYDDYREKRWFLVHKNELQEFLPKNYQVRGAV